MNRSLAGRLVVATVVTALACVLLFVGGLLFAISQEVDTLRDRGLRGQASDVARHLQADENGRLSLTLPPTLAASYEAARGVYVYTVVDAAGRVLFSSDGRDEPLLRDFDPGRVEDYFSFRTPAVEGTFFGVSLRLEHPGSRLWVQVAQGPEHRDVLADTLFDELSETIMWMVIGFVAAIVVANIMVIRRSLSPLRTASEQAATIGPDRPNVRLAVAEMPLEIVPLVGAVNSALDRLARGIQVQQEFTADAAHELRTPLAVLRANISSIDDPATRFSLRDDVLRIENLVTQLLRLSQIEGLDHAAGETADLHAVALDVANMLAPVAVGQGRPIAIVWAGGAIPVLGSAEALELALRNLVENALRHTPRGTPIEILLDDRPALSVVDHGPGIPPDQRERVFQRFWRGDRRGNTPGAGLGMSIVARAVETLGGSIDIGDTPGGGATITILLRTPPNDGS